MKGYEFAAKRLDSYSNTILRPSKTSSDNEPLRRELTRKLISRLKMMYQNDHNKLEGYKYFLYFSYHEQLSNERRKV